MGFDIVSNLTDSMGGGMAEFFAPMQILLVLIIALVVFGPKRLPELGKQIGSALRDFNKVKSDLMKQFTLDHDPEPEREPYNYNYPAAEETTYSTAAYTPPPDYTDYTIAAKKVEPSAAEGALARTAHTEELSARESYDYVDAGRSDADFRGDSNVNHGKTEHTELASSSEYVPAKALGIHANGYANGNSAPAETISTPVAPSGQTASATGGPAVNGAHAEIVREV